MAGKIFFVGLLLPSINRFKAEQKWVTSAVKTCVIASKNRQKHVKSVVS